MTDRLRLLVVTDIHHDADAPPAADDHGRWCGLGAELLRRAMEDAVRRGGFDAAALLGDAINDETSASADHSLAQVREQLDAAAAGKPRIIVCGNHDVEAGRLLDALGGRDGAVDLPGCRFVAFRDVYDEKDCCTRPDEQRRLLTAGSFAGPVIALQHNPMHPLIDDPYPYMMTNRTAIMDDYARDGVALSISGHYHTGQGPTSLDGVRYFTCPALCVWPFQYAMVTVAGRDIDVDVRRLALPPELAIVDCHCHTEFAYCGRGISAEMAIHRAGMFGLGGICLTEHAPQLYCLADDFWVGRHIREPAVWREGPRRMDAFRRIVEPLRSDKVRVGLEVELDCQGSLTLRDCDRNVPDVLVGAVHFLEKKVEEYSDAELERAFLDKCRGLIDSGIDVLAHPLRLFTWSKRPVPSGVVSAVVEMLAESGVAAEINFHLNTPGDDFVAACLHAGIELAFGSDAHRGDEIAHLSAQLAMLHRLAGAIDVGKLLWRP